MTSQEVLNHPDVMILLLSFCQIKIKRSAKDLSLQTLRVNFFLIDHEKSILTTKINVDHFLSDVLSIFWK